MTPRPTRRRHEDGIVDFLIDCGWLSCSGDRLPDQTWELIFNVWITTRTRLGGETMTRQNPTESLRKRLQEVGLSTRFDHDHCVKWLVGRVPTVNLRKLMDNMNKIVVASPDQFSEPIDFPD
jgi:hypothetical protein